MISLKMKKFPFELEDNSFSRLAILIGYPILSLVLTYGTTGASYEKYFRPPPSNIYYDAMFVAICWSVSISEWISRIDGIELNAYLIFKTAFPSVIGILYCTVGSFGSGIVWIIYAMVLLVLSLNVSTSFKIVRERNGFLWVYTVFMIIVSIGFIAFPVSQDWSGPPEPFVRWHPYGTDGERVWRGIFATYAVCMTYSAIEDPIGKHMEFTRFLSISAFIHSTVMLIMNLVELGKSMSNGNSQHLYGDIAGWYLISLMAAIAARQNH